MEQKQLSIKRIYLSAESTNERNSRLPIGVTDVIVFLDNGNIYLAAFFSYRYLEVIIKNHQKTGEFLNGKYFHANNMILIDDCSKSSITQVVEDLIVEGDFFGVFRKISK